MKQITALFLALFYLSTSIGATIHWHYCMGKVISWSLIEAKDHHCSKCGMMKKGTENPTTVSSKDCCHDKDTQLKSSTDQKILPAAPGFRSVAIIPAGLPVVNCLMLQRSDLKNDPSHAPPDSCIPVFLLHKNIRL